MDLTAIVLMLVWIGVGLIVVGIVFAAIGFFTEKDEGIGTRSGNFIALLLDLARTCFKIMADPNETRARKLQAFGMILILFGLLFLVTSVIPLLVDALGKALGGVPDGPTDTPTPTPTAR